MIVREVTNHQNNQIKAGVITSTANNTEKIRTMLVPKVEALMRSLLSPFLWLRGDRNYRSLGGEGKMPDEKQTEKKTTCWIWTFIIRNEPNDHQDTFFETMI